jgi:hypothetical protein
MATFPMFDRLLRHWTDQPPQLRQEELRGQRPTDGSNDGALVYTDQDHAKDHHHAQLRRERLERADQMGEDPVQEKFLRVWKDVK